MAPQSRKLAGDMKRSFSIIMRCDGDKEIGLGHVYRCLVLARELRDHYSWVVLFAMSSGMAGISKVRDEFFPVNVKPEGIPEEVWLELLVNELHPDALFFDIRTDLKREAIERLKMNSSLVVTFDDASDRRLASDLAFYPPVPQARRLRWPHYKGQALIGWEWLLVQEEYYRPRSTHQNAVPRILVTMGGSDPANLTLLAIKALEMVDEKITAVLVLGPAFSHDEEISDALSKAKRSYEIHRNLPDLVEQGLHTDFAVAAFGGTAYEMAAMGVPTVLLGLTADHAASAQCLADIGLSLNLGETSAVTPRKLAKAISEILQRPAWVVAVPEKARKLFRTPGAQTMAKKIMQAVERIF